MKQYPDLVAFSQVIVAAALLMTISVHAGETNAESDAVANQTKETPEAILGPEPAAESNSNTDTNESDSSMLPLPTNQQSYDGLIAISPPAGLQLPPPDTNYSNWQGVNVGFASMRIPPGWIIQEQIGAGTEDHTTGWASAAGDIYIELRQIQNSDSNYLQTAADHAQSDYRQSAARLKEGVIFGFQPMILDGAIGGVEIMNQFGREKNEDGSLTARMISWRGRWMKDDSIQKAEFTATFAQDQQENFAPLVSSILASLKTSNVELAK